jgi:hypothetical protein
MTELTPALDAALSADRPLVFGALELDLPGGAARFLDGAGEISFAGRTFVGTDPTFGTIAAIDAITDGGSDEAPGLGLTLLPPNDTAAAVLAGATVQGATATVWIGAIDSATGIPVPDPYLAFLGEVDVATIRAGENGRSVDYDLVSMSERFFDADEGFRLNQSFHQSVWPGETGFFDVTGIEQTIYWGVAPPPGVVSAGGSSSRGSGGSAGGGEWERVL